MVEFTLFIVGKYSLFKSDMLFTIYFAIVSPLLTKSIKLIDFKIAVCLALWPALLFTALF